MFAQKVHVGLGWVFGVWGTLRGRVLGGGIYDLSRGLKYLLRATGSASVQVFGLYITNSKLPSGSFEIMISKLPEGSFEKLLRNFSL